MFTWAQLMYHWANHVSITGRRGMKCSMRSKYLPGGVVFGIVKLSYSRFYPLISGLSHFSLRLPGSGSTRTVERERKLTSGFLQSDHAVFKLGPP